MGVLRVGEAIALIFIVLVERHLVFIVSCLKVAQAAALRVTLSGTVERLCLTVCFSANITLCMDLMKSQTTMQVTAAFAFALVTLIG